MSLKQKLAQPYPISSFRAALRRDLLLAVFAAAFLLLFRPFGLDAVHDHERNHLILGCGAVTLFTLWINESLAYKGLSRQFTEARWTILSQILYVIWKILALGFVNFLFLGFIGDIQPTLSGLLQTQERVFICCIFPVIFFILFWQNHLLKRNLAEALELERNITQPVGAGPAINPKVRLQFTGENKGEVLEIPGDSLLYMVSQDNYVEFVWEEEGLVKRALLRSTLSKAEEILADSPSFFRSHRAYVVNLSKVTTVAGNAQGYTLEIPGIGLLIPVSRGRGKELNRLLKEGKAVAPALL